MEKISLIFLYMSRVTYLLGAGASYGERGTSNGGNKIFVRGLPVINELEEAIHTIIPRNQYGAYDTDGNYAEAEGVGKVSYINLVNALMDLKEMCASYPTIDTLAKQLYVTHSYYITESGRRVAYEDLKRYLAMALLMFQDHKTRDLRYDAFLASVIDDHGKLPPMTILSWNYDAQFELAYSGYSTESRYIPFLWKKLNVLNKTYASDFNPDANFAMIKLNGTAFFSDMRYKDEIYGSSEAGIRDCFFGGERKTKVQYAADYLSSVCHNRLSYAWEKDGFEKMKDNLIKRINNTEELVVIGYSFPYVNNSVDTFVIKNMRRLQKVIIQDPNPEEIEERIRTMTNSIYQVEYVPKQWKQFYISQGF